MSRKFSITSANAKMTLFCALFPAGLNFENFAVGNAWTQELIQQLEARMGVDGMISFGYTPQVKTLQVTLSPNSATVDRMDYLVQSQDLAQDAVICQMSIELKALKKRIVLQNGACTNSKLLADGQAVLEPQQYNFAFESVNVSPI